MANFCGELIGTVTIGGTITGQVDYPEKVYVHDRFPDYEGSYTAIPDVENDQIFATRNKSLLQDFEVVKIPYQEVTNPQGGITATIGGY